VLQIIPQFAELVDYLDVGRRHGHAASREAI
jgi:hypothetical protein